MDVGIVREQVEPEGTQAVSPVVGFPPRGEPMLGNLSAGVAKRTHAGQVVMNPRQIRATLQQRDQLVALERWRGPDGQSTDDGGEEAGDARLVSGVQQECGVSRALHEHLERFVISGLQRSCPRPTELVEHELGGPPTHGLTLTESFLRTHREGSAELSTLVLGRGDWKGCETTQDITSEVVMCSGEHDGLSDEPERYFDSGELAGPQGVAKLFARSDRQRLRFFLEHSQGAADRTLGLDGN